jgi:hypothetical protein
MCICRYETYGWRKKEGSIQPPKTVSPAANLVHQPAGMDLPSYSFGKDERFEPGDDY